MGIFVVPEAARFGTLAPPARTIASRPDPLSPWALDHDRLTELADRWAVPYRTAAPFPHVVLDDVFPDGLLDEVVAEFPPADDPGWTLEDMAMQRKQQWCDANRLPPVPASFIALLQAAPYLTFLERLTGIDGLIGDPHCHHGGLHQTLPGGFLKVHTDQAEQPSLRLQRRVNMIVYLNRDWSPEWGGELELWDSEMTRCLERIEPRFNRAVIFDALGSNHGHPDPAKSPPGMIRRSVALYYYVSPAHLSASAEVPPSVVRARPGEVLRQPQRQSSSRLRHVARDVLPPILARRLRRTRGR